MPRGVRLRSNAKTLSRHCWCVALLRFLVGKRAPWKAGVTRIPPQMSPSFLDTVYRVALGFLTLAQGQLVFYKGSVAEVRAPITQGGGIPILVYSAVPGDANAWVLGCATKVVVVGRADLKVVVDWDVTNGHVTVRT